MQVQTFFKYVVQWDGTIAAFVLYDARENCETYCRDPEKLEILGNIYEKSRTFRRIKWTT